LCPPPQRALGCQQVADATADCRNAHSGSDGLSIGDGEFKRNRGPEFFDGERYRRRPGDNARLPSDDVRRADAVRGNQGNGGPVVLALEILADGQADDLPAIFDRLGIPLDLSKVAGHLQSLPPGVI
jgi:hypothetical protein